MITTSEYQCPACGNNIPPENINVSHDIVQCPACHEPVAFDELINSKEEDRILSSPPKYITVEKTTQGITITYKRKGIFTAILIFIAIVQLSIIGAIMVPSMIKTFSPFWIPIILIEVIILCVVTFSLFTKSVITVSPGKGTYFAGAGKIGLSRQFHLAFETKFGEKVIGNVNGKPTKAMTINTPPHGCITIGHFMSENTYPFLKAVFRQLRK